MSIEDIVRTSMGQLARDLEPTAPHPAATRGRVNRGRRVRAIAVAGLAAAVAAAIVVSVTDLGHRSKSLGPAHAVVIGVQADAVWMVDGVLHLADRAYPQDQTIETALVPTRDGAVFGASGGAVVYQPAEGEARIVTTYGAAHPQGGPTPVGPAADPDSDAVAVLRWSTDDGRYDLFVGHAARKQRIDLAQPIGDGWKLPGDPNPFGDHLLAPIYWFGAVADGDYATLIRKGRELWRSDVKGNGGGSLTPLGDAPLDATLEVVADVTSDRRLAFTTAKGKPLVTVGDVEPDGGLSHDGGYYVGSSTDPAHAGEIAVVDTHTGDTRFIAPPEGTSQTSLSWSRGHTLMFRAPSADSAPSGLVVACDADTLGCTTVAEVDDIDQVVLPRL
jgi:hypothetical protein